MPCAVSVVKKMCNPLISENCNKAEANGCAGILKGIACSARAVIEDSNKIKMTVRNEILTVNIRFIYKTIGASKSIYLIFYFFYLAEIKTSFSVIL